MMPKGRELKLGILYIATGNLYQKFTQKLKLFLASVLLE